MWKFNSQSRRLQRIKRPYGSTIYICKWNAAWNEYTTKGFPRLYGRRLFNALPPLGIYSPKWSRLSSLVKDLVTKSQGVYVLCLGVSDKMLPQIVSRFRRFRACMGGNASVAPAPVLLKWAESVWIMRRTWDSQMVRSWTPFPFWGGYSVEW